MTGANNPAGATVFADAPAALFDLQKLLDATPEALRPVVAQYGPALIAMTAAEFLGWLDDMLFGRTAEAWAAIWSRLPNAELVDAWRSQNDKWDAANARQAESLSLQRSAAMAVLKVLLASALGAVGL